MRAAVGTVHRATAGAIDSLVMRRVLALAHAGWEGKFVARALQDEGWPGERSSLAVSPKGDVESSRSLVIDTARYAAVVAVDSGASGHASALERYVASGGGLILGPRMRNSGCRRLPRGRAQRRCVGSRELPDSAPSRAWCSRRWRGRRLERWYSSGAIRSFRGGAACGSRARRADRLRGYLAGGAWQAGDSGAAAHRAWWRLEWSR